MFLSGITTYEWDSKNISHILQHQVRPDEVEEACYNNPVVLKTRGNCYLVLGRSNTGKYLSIVVAPKEEGKTRVITARNMDHKERKLFTRKRK
ncbi:MAG: BrnT family toxin [Elusimicrobiota bacterium]